MLDDDTFFRIAHEIAKAGTCSRLNVGALVVRDNRIIATGYNGTATKLPHCHHYDDKPCHKSVHAETNAIVFAARNGLSTDRATLYCTHAPCDACAGIIVNAGIAQVKYHTSYRNDNGLASLIEAGITVFKFGEEDPHRHIRLQRSKWSFDPNMPFVSENAVYSDD